MPKINKREIVKKFVILPQDYNTNRAFWQKEMSLLKKLLEYFPIEFIDSVSPKKKIKSLAILWHPKFRERLKVLYRESKYKPDKSRYQDVELSSEKFGEDYTPTKSKSISQWLRE
jgi:hypothetical protein